MLSNISRGKGNQTKKFSQLIEYKMSGETIPKPFPKPFPFQTLFYTFRTVV